MRRLSIPSALLFVAACAVCRAAGSAPTGAPYDGEWAVSLVCPDSRDRSGLVKGYEYTFHVSIVDGKLRGQYGASGAPASVAYSGEVGADGTLELRAVGKTGQSDHAAGKVARGSDYSYTMSGRLEQSHGQAVRREQRSCTATFDKL
jgi:hypothetical protein